MKKLFNISFTVLAVLMLVLIALTHANRVRFEEQCAETCDSAYRVQDGRCFCEVVP